MSALELGAVAAGQEVTFEPLTKVLAAAPADQEPAPGFSCLWRGQPYTGRTVLERTAVIEDANGDRHLANKLALLVDPATVRWQAPALLPIKLRWRRPGAGAVEQESSIGDPEPGVVEEDEAGDRLYAAEDDQLPAEIDELSLDAEEPDGIDDVTTGQEAESSPPPAAAGAQPDGPRSCGRCGRPIPGHNRRGVCGLCRSTCPSCGGGKAPQAEKCSRCAGRGRRPAGSPPPMAELAANGAEAIAGQPSEAADPQLTTAAAPPAADVDAAMTSSATPDGPDDQITEAADPEAQAGARVAGDVAVEATPRMGDGDHHEGAFVETDAPRLCGSCAQPLPRHNRKGVCTACQGTCPSCGGPKAPQSDRCRACRREEPPGFAAEALSAAAALEDLPELVRELHEQFVTVARYAQELEDELAIYKAADRRRARSQ